MLAKNAETFLACDGEYGDARIVIFGAPYDSTCSYRPGARFGPGAIRHESYGLETWSPCLDMDLSDCAAFDSGDLELPFGDSRRALDMIRERAAVILADGKLPLLLGGEHLVTLGAAEAALRAYPDMHIIHFDAHADLEDRYLGVSLSHASVIRRCFDLMGDGRIHQFCVRSGLREQFLFARRHTDFHPFGFDGLKEVCAGLREEKVPVYLTLDLDCLDPSVFPGTGTPEPGGVGFMELMDAIYTVCKTRLIGADVVELAPTLDQSGISTAAACKVVRELIAGIAKEAQIIKEGKS